MLNEIGTLTAFTAEGKIETQIATPIIGENWFTRIAMAMETPEGIEIRRPTHNDLTRPLKKKRLILVINSSTK